MHCIVCGHDAGFHRAVVDTFDDETVGGICRECEREEFGRTLERGFFVERDGCALCSRDGAVAIPRWQPVAERTSDGTIVNSVRYRIDAETVRLCDEHVATIADGFPMARKTPVVTE